MAPRGIARRRETGVSVGAFRGGVTGACSKRCTGVHRREIRITPIEEMNDVPTS
jgi:hypothetical protein